MSKILPYLEVFVTPVTGEDVMVGDHFLSRPAVSNQLLTQFHRLQDWLAILFIFSNKKYDQCSNFNKNAVVIVKTVIPMS